MKASDLQSVTLNKVDPDDINDQSEARFAKRRDDRSLGHHSGSIAEMHGLGAASLSQLEEKFLKHNRADLWEIARTQVFDVPPAEWAAPARVVEDSRQARPGYQGTLKHEYEEEAGVLRRKVRLLGLLLRLSEHCVVYSGAGISTASGIDDYATSTASTAIATTTPRSHYDALPTYAHRALTSLHRAGLLKHWVQQNHDGLPQKAGYPQACLNEIHGAWYAPDNPVIPMSGSLRGDYFEWLLEWEQRADLCLAVGTSLAGMNADRIVTSTAKRARRQQAIGSVIINLQTTLIDSQSVLRIFGKLDQVLELLAEELQLEVGPPYQPPYQLQVEAEEEDVYLQAAYNAEGQRIKPEVGRGMLLDLREDAKVKVTHGMYAGHEGEVCGRNKEGHYNVRIFHPLKGTFKAPKVWCLGLWWIESGYNGSVPTIPIVNIGDSLRYKTY